MKLKNKKLSRYTFSFLDDNINNYILYNSRNNNTILAEKDAFDNIIRYLDAVSKFFLNKNEKGIFDFLYKEGFIIDFDRDEIKEVGCEIERDKYSDKRLILSIAVTENCNLDCKYCFISKTKTTFSIKNIAMLKSFIEEYNDIYRPEGIDITWYGGEPLLAIKEINEISSEILNLRKKWDLDYSAALITNGTLLKKNLQYLKQLRIKYIQVSIEPSREINDELRPFKNGSSSFDFIYNNVKQIADKISIILKIALSKKNSHYVYDFVKKLKKDNLLSKKVDFSLGPLHALASKNYFLDIAYNSKEYSDVFFEIYEKLLNDGIIDYAMYPLTRISCGAIKNNVFSISSRGEIYKCFEHIGNKKYSVGNLSEKFTWSKNLSEWLYTNPAKNYKCRECRILPICNGGCWATKIHQNESPVGYFCDQLCSVWKYNLEKGLKIYLKSKKMKYKPICT